MSSSSSETVGAIVQETEADVEVVVRLRAGAPEALSELFEAYGDRIHGHCFRSLGSWHEAEDATATVFLEVWRHRERVKLVDDSAMPWLYGVATNVCRNAARGRRRRRRLADRVSGPAPASDHAERVGDRIDAETRMREVLAAISGLPDREREVLALVVWAGLSYEQVSTALGVPVGTVRSRLSRARRRLSLADPDSEGAS